MKRFWGFALLLSLLSIPAFAAKNSENLHLSKNMTIGSIKLDAGDYKVSWTGTEPSVQVTFTQAGKDVATVPAQLTPEKNSGPFLESESVNGAESLQVVHFPKVKLVLQAPSK